MMISRAIYEKAKLATTLDDVDGGTERINRILEILDIEVEVCRHCGGTGKLESEELSQIVSAAVAAIEFYTDRQGVTPHIFKSLRAALRKAGARDI